MDSEVDDTCKDFRTDDSQGSPDNIQSDIFLLLNQPENKRCVDCKDEGVTHVNASLGVFICKSCAVLHQGLVPRLNRVLAISETTSDNIEILTTVGNKASNDRYERRLPSCYRRPTHSDPLVFMEQWIKAKYERKEFVDGEPLPSYLEKVKEGNLWKRGKESKQFKLRKFVLCKHSKTLKYFVEDGPNSAPKAKLDLDNIDAFVVPEKFENSNGMQIMFEHKRLTRSLFVYSDTAEELISWYTAIYAAKLQWLQIAFPCSPVHELCKGLWPRIMKEGWLMKCGPKKNDRFHKRWITLLNRRMLYSANVMDAFPKGDVFIGSFESQSYWVKVPENFENTSSQDAGFIFMFGTPERTFTLMTDSEQLRREWVDVITSIIKTPLLPFEQKEFTRRGPRVINKRFSSLFVG